ncbi:MAG: hypothetical protein A3B68_00920 [Candidatus Melainabacteria bacterium RIFCSPHIGHO2_02_FULL_34_12]|nr:MAG: hypothetical protein A3B68_00920 [Candidatus Melainabacteria bacterium RIFCSPHIGHO2_02_FULL_34_12]
MFILFAISGAQAGDSSKSTGNDLLITGPKKKEKPPQPKEREPVFDSFESYQGSSPEVKNNSLAHAGSFDFNPVLGDKQIEKLIPDIHGEHAARLSEYVEANKSNPGRYKFIQLGEEKSDVTRAQFLKTFSEEQAQYEKALERILGSDNETRELMRVYAALTFSVSNPRAAIAALGNLLGVLETASAKQLASGSIADIASYAVKQALIKAKYDPKSDEARQLSSVLNTIAYSCLSSGCLNPNSEVAYAGGGVGVGNGNVDDFSNVSSSGVSTSGQEGAKVSSESRADRIVVVDTESGEVVDDIDVVYIEPPEGDNCGQVCQTVGSDIEAAQAAAQEGVGSERRITGKLELQNKEVSNAREGLIGLNGEKANILSSETLDTGKLSVVENQIGAANRTIAIG